MINAVIYSRVSSESERQDTERQTEELKDYADRMGYTIVEVYEEKVSGFKKNEQRPIFSKMLEDIQTNHIDKEQVRSPYLTDCSETPTGLDCPPLSTLSSWAAALGPLRSLRDLPVLVNILRLKL